MGLVSLSTPFIETKDVNLVDMRYIEATVFAKCLAVRITDLEAKFGSVIASILIDGETKRYIDVWIHGRNIMRTFTLWDATMVEKAMGQFKPMLNHIDNGMTADKFEMLMAVHGTRCAELIEQIRRARVEDIYAATVSSREFVERARKQGRADAEIEKNRILEEVRQQAKAEAEIEKAQIIDAFNVQMAKWKKQAESSTFGEAVSKFAAAQSKALEEEKQCHIPVLITSMDQKRLLVVNKNVLEAAFELPPPTVGVPPPKVVKITNSETPPTESAQKKQKN